RRSCRTMQSSPFPLHALAFRFTAIADRLGFFLEPVKLVQPLGAVSETLVMAMQRLELFFGELFDVDESIAGAARAADELVQFQLNRLGIFVLRALDEEDH